VRNDERLVRQRHLWKPIWRKHWQSASPNASTRRRNARPARPIARRLDKYSCVLVQGPPGTGKTHTIGNLVGHLLAQGKSVLVTSHSVKALRVLREQVVEGLRPLCVSVLEAGGENQAQLKSAISGIVERLQGTNADTMNRQADGFQQERFKILNRLESTRARLHDARADEYRDVVVGGQSWSPSDAARIIADVKRRPSPIHDNEVWVSR
jgi:Rad3-related DNA helicase